MKEYDNIKKKILSKLNILKENINYDLCIIYDKNINLKYQQDILDLANNDISLLPIYYNNSSDLDKKRFSNLISNIYKDERKKEEFIYEFINLNKLNKKRFINELEYGHSNLKIAEFLNRIRDNIIENKKNIEKEKTLTKKLYIINNIIDYLNSKPGEKEITNIEEYIKYLENIGLNINLINQFIYIVINNNILFYKNK